MTNWKTVQPSVGSLAQDAYLPHEIDELPNADKVWATVMSVVDQMYAEIDLLQDRLDDLEYDH